jgi:RNA polymerase sigma-70 factor (ECF subfamily)
MIGAMGGAAEVSGDGAEARAAAATPPTLAALVATHKAAVYGYLSRSGVAPADRDDLFQEIFLRAHGALGTAPAGAIAPWLFTIVVNAVRSHFRKTRVRAIVRLDAAPGDDVVAAEPGPDHALEARRTAAWLDGQIARLPLEQREALLLCAIEGMEIADAAEALGAPAETIKTRLRRARLALAEARAKQAMRAEREEREGGSR